MYDFIKVRAIGVTQPLVDFIPDSEGIISYAARVSAPNNQTNFETADKLLGYCAKNAHWSVFETCSITMEIEAPRDICRQILRHRSFSFQEFSQRYAEATKFCYRDVRLQDHKNRQNSIATDDEELKAWWNEEQEWLIGHISRLYEDAIAKGIAKEVARVLLPEGLTMSKMYMQGSVRSWMHYINLRSDNGTQLEHCDVALKAKEEFIKLFPSLEKFV